MKFVLDVRDFLEKNTHSYLLDEEHLSLIENNNYILSFKNNIFFSGIKKPFMEMNADFYFDQDRKHFDVRKIEDIEYFYNKLANVVSLYDRRYYREKIVINLDVNDVNEKFHLFKLLSLIIIFLKICLRLNQICGLNIKKSKQSFLDLKALLLISNKNYSIFENFSGLFSKNLLSAHANALFDSRMLNMKLKLEERKIKKLLNQEKVLMPPLETIMLLLSNNDLLKEIDKKAKLDNMSSLFNNERLESFVKNEKYMIDKINHIDGLFFLDEKNQRFSFCMDDFYVDNEIDMFEVFYQDVSITLKSTKKISDSYNESITLSLNTVTNELTFHKNRQGIKAYVINKKDLETLRAKYKSQNYDESKSEVLFLCYVLNEKYIIQN